jgi:hypothetical protein
MKLFILISLLVITSISFGQSFKAEQRKYSRVRDAYSEKEDTLLSLYKSKGFESLAIDIYIRAI